MATIRWRRNDGLDLLHFIFEICRWISEGIPSQPRKHGCLQNKWKGICYQAFTPLYFPFARLYYSPHRNFWRHEPIPPADANHHLGTLCIQTDLHNLSDLQMPGTHRPLLVLNSWLIEVHSPGKTSQWIANTSCNRVGAYIKRVHAQTCRNRTPCTCETQSVCLS